LAAALSIRDQLTVVAPDDGVVLTRYVNPGEALTSGAPVVSLGLVHRPWIRAYVGDLAIARVRRGDAVTGRVAGADRRSLGRLAAAGGPPGVETRGLTRRFGPVTAVRELTLRIERGEVFGLLGPNGSGKTTTIRMLCGILEPSAGSATVAGIDVAAAPEQVRQ